MRKLLALSLASTALAAVAVPLVSNVTMSQGGGTVTIGYTLSEEPGIVTLDIQTNAAENVWVSIKGESLTYLSGDVNKRVGIGAHAITWKARKALPFDKISKDVRAVVTAWSLSEPPDYMVASLTNANDLAFYVDAATVPGGVTNDMYKTDYLVMRKCPAANVPWRIGSWPNEPQRTAETEVPHVVTLSTDYYICIYPITQRQYELIMLANGAKSTDARPSSFSLESCYATRPVERVSYEKLRGTVADGFDWPTTGHAVREDGYINYMRTHTGLVGIDLPTEAQWEFACRAGCGAGLYNGKELPRSITATNTVSDLDMINELGRHRGNGGREDGLFGTEMTADRYPVVTTEFGTAKVGSYLPNAWGLYDMLGNVREWCLDWFKDDCSGADPETGPTEGDEWPSAGSKDQQLSGRALRGGGYGYSPKNCRCADRGHTTASSSWTQIGFRLVCPVTIPAAAQ